MDVQFYGANCVVLTTKELRIVVDDTLAKLGAKSVMKAGDVLLFTGEHDVPTVDARMIIDMPGEYEIGSVSIVGIPARAHMDEAATSNATIYKITYGDATYVLTGHVYPELTESQLETIGMTDVLFVPVGGNGYTLDPVGAMKISRSIEPKLLVPTHYDDKGLKYEVPQQSLDQVLKEWAMEPKDRLEKLRLKPGELSDTTQLLILEKA